MGSESVITKDYTVPPSAYAQNALARMASRYGWYIALPILILAAYGMLADWRWLVVAAAMIFIAIPVLLMFAWIHLLAQPGVSESVFPSRLLFYPSKNQVLIEYLPFLSPEEIKGELDDEHLSSKTEPRVPSTRIIDIGDITGIELYGKYYVMHYKCTDGNAQHMVPLSAFISSDDCINFARIATTH